MSYEGQTAAVARSGAAVPATGLTALRTRGLTKRYGQRLAVADLNLEVRRGEIFGFLGPNGAGKTTTIRMLLGLITPTAGSIEILGQNLQRQPRLVLPRVGALIETPALYLYLSARDNLRAVASSLGGVSERRIDEILELVGLSNRQKDRVRTYSLGMKQRLGLALALLHDPELLILDEPANGLDPAGIVEMRDLLYKLAAQGKTIFISSHLLSEVQQICTRVAIIRLGRLVTEASVEDLTRGRGEFVVRLDYPHEALRLVRAQPWGATAYLNQNGELVTPAPSGRGRELNRFLVEAGFIPDSLAPATLDLEQVFLQLTADAAAMGGKVLS
ncbi:ABC transporter ATP-binding protein [Thermogemmatispora onikobensis]|uniref:ABC transporter ATP-binding protein n=1 Tax=Thermogemmatispora onikobensis TaxID=732234 RepID=UPI000AD1F941|nr:ABC transporter ATP-binding protein [Thermogemmatispora onikobensis]